ncbi:MAG: c-type cytochrome [Saprospiraceae bacterium]|nr:c-type cytochrome [Saprospiraceae bacterium]
MIRDYFPVFFITVLLVAISSCKDQNSQLIKIQHGDNISLIGNNLCSRMINYGHFETSMHLANPDKELTIRNMCDGGNTPGFRPHSGRDSPWSFPTADQYYDEESQPSGSRGHLESPDQWLSRLEADVILAFFGYNESFQGLQGLENFKSELSAFIDHSLKQNYNGISSSKLVLISPIAFEDLSSVKDLPDGKKENENLKLYNEAINEVANKHSIPFINLFDVSLELYKSEGPFTIDGFQLNDKGNQWLGNYLTTTITGSSSRKESIRDMVHEAVMEKNWFWHYDYKMPNGVHVFGRRYEPFGPDNYPSEIKKIREMTAIRDTAIWMACKGKEMDLESSDKKTTVLPEIETNYQDVHGRGDLKYLYGEEALNSFSIPDGYKIELFASEKEFPDLANPVQCSFDNKGRLWVAVMPTYPHYQPGDPKPNDKLIILEDRDKDGKADNQITFADGLHLPIGFELASEGVYISQGTNLKMLIDSDGDDVADKEEVLLSGFDDHDTHHAISAFCADPSGAIYMGEGVFLHSNIETSYGPVRATNGGFFRYNPARSHLERTSQVSIPNPWGIAFDDWGQNFFAETSGPDVLWMMPGSIKPRYGKASPKSRNLIEDAHRVRPTSGLEFVSSRHFPDDVQGDLLINNTIGFLGTKQHKIYDDGTGYKSEHRLDLITSTDRNFRPVDMEFAPDGSLYVVDWHNVLIGHMQHNARDPLRDHVHGRIYRITHPSRPMVDPVNIVDADINTLLNLLKLPEYRTRYRVRRELRGRNADDALNAIQSWTEELDQSDPRYEHHLLEALWVSWGVNQVDHELTTTLLKSKDHRVRAAAVRVLKYMNHQIPDAINLLIEAGADPHGRVRLEAIVTASWLDVSNGMKILNEAKKYPLDDWMKGPYEAALAHLNGRSVNPVQSEEIVSHLEGAELELYKKGKEIYARDAFCSTCHQPDGKGLKAVGYPPLSKSEWATGDEDKLIKLTLKGLMGPITVLGREYSGKVPMTPYEGLMNNEEVAAVLTYIRNSFGNKASVIKPDKVASVRSAIKDKNGFYTTAELLSEYQSQ